MGMPLHFWDSRIPSFRPPERSLVRSPRFTPSRPTPTAEPDLARGLAIPELESRPGLPGPTPNHGQELR